MRKTILLGFGLTCAVTLALACGSTDGTSSFGNGNPDNADASGSPDPGDPGTFGPGDDAGESDAQTPGAAQNIQSLRIDPADATLDVDLGKAATKTYRVFATMKENPGQEIDITDRAVFYTPAGYLIGRFPADGKPTFSTHLPDATDTWPQRGGTVTVEASASNSDGSITKATTTLKVNVHGASIFAAGTPEATPAIPANPQSQFTGTADAAHAPTIYYPNDGTMLPPNLKRLEIHWKKKAAADKLFEVAFTGDGTDLRVYTRCTDTPTDFEAGAFETGAGICAIRIDEATYGALAEANRGKGPVKLRVRASNESGAFGESAEQTVEFAENRVDGGIYYWTTSSPPRIVRFDFGSGTGKPEAYLQPSKDGLSNTCVGCHALSRDGNKIVASVGNSSDGRIVFVKDVKTKNIALNNSNDASSNGNAVDLNRILLASFNPDASQIVTVVPTNSSLSPKLVFHDGNTGQKSYEINVGFTPSHPDWSPDGKSIAVTRIGGTNDRTINFSGGGIDVLRNAGTWAAGATLTDEKIVPKVSGKNRYNPSFFPDGSILLYSESSCDSGQLCDAYSDESAKTWAVQPKAGATPILLKNVAKPGVNDGSNTNLMDTFPRATPFVTDHRGGKLMWFTQSSQRRAGLRKFNPQSSVVGDKATQTTLWMFAIDPAKILAGDGDTSNYTGFFLPFQDLSTSNHMAQWTQKIATDNPAPPPPPSPPPPAPPPPPPPVK